MTVTSNFGIMHRPCFSGYPFQGRNTFFLFTINPFIQRYLHQLEYIFGPLTKYSEVSYFFDTHFGDSSTQNFQKDFQKKFSSH